nr:MAG TPA: hypothetical protein [Caudoviricetes sp.]
MDLAFFPEVWKILAVILLIQPVHKSLRKVHGFQVQIILAGRIRFDDHNGKAVFLQDIADNIFLFHLVRIICDQ